MITFILAKIFGIYLIIMGLLLLVNRKRVQALSMDLLGNEPVLWSLSFVTLILGIILIVIHNVWVFNWPVIITLLAWLTFIKGLTNVWRPDWGAYTSVILKKKSLIYIIGIIDVLLGIFLLLKGLKVF